MKVQAKHTATFQWEWSKVFRKKISNRTAVEAVEEIGEKVPYAAEGEAPWRLPETWELQKAFQDKVEGFKGRNFVVENDRYLFMVDMTNGSQLDFKLPSKGKHMIYIRFVRTPGMGIDNQP